MDKTTAQKLIATATDLDELLEALRTIEAALDDATTMDTLIEVAELPVYGGEAPASTIGVWSWDSTRLLVGDSSWRECEICTREEHSGSTAGWTPTRRYGF